MLVDGYESECEVILRRTEVVQEGYRKARPSKPQPRMLGISKKPGPPVPPRPSAAAVATALAKQRENSPSPTTLRPPHPGRTVVYKSPDFSLPPNRTPPPPLTSFGPAKPLQRQQPLQGPKSHHDAASGVGDDGGSRGSPLSGGVMYRSTCSIVEINTSSSGSSSASTSPVATLQKPPEPKGKPKPAEAPAVALPVARRRTRAGETGMASDSSSGDVIIVNGANGSSTISLSLGVGSAPATEEEEEDARKGHHRKQQLAGELDFHDSGTERGDSSGSSASAGSTLERENNLRNLETISNSSSNSNSSSSSSNAKSSHFTEIIIGSNQSSTVVRSGSKPNVAARTLEAPIVPAGGASVIRSSSVRLPIGVPPPYRRPEPEGGEQVLPSSDNSSSGVTRATTGSGTAGPAVLGKKQPLSATAATKAPGLDQATLDSKLSEKKLAFHELLISELTAMRQKQQQQQLEKEEQEERKRRAHQELQQQGEEEMVCGAPPQGDPPVAAHPERTSAERSGGSPAQLGGTDLAKINRRQRCPSERRSSCSESDVSPNGTAGRLPKIRTADWIEVGDNGTQVVLSSCQISLEDSGMEDEEKPDDASSGVGDSWDSVKEGVEDHRIIMSLPGLPPLPKSLSGFDLAGIQFQSHHHLHHHHHLPHHHHQPHHSPAAQHNPHYPPRHPPAHHQQSTASHQSHHHQQSFHATTGGMSTHSSVLPPSPQMTQVTAALNHHHTNPFIPIGPSSMLLHAGAGAGGAGGGGVGAGPGHDGQQQQQQQRGHSPVGSTLSGGRKASPQPSQQSAVPGSGQTTTLDTQLAILRREMYGLRQLDLSLLSQLWALNESIQEFRTMLQEQETLSPPSPSPSNSDANSVSSDDDLDEDDSSATTNSNRISQQQQHQQQQQLQQQHLLLSAQHALQSSTNSIVGASGGGNTSGSGGGGGNANESGGSTTTTLSSSASSRMRAPPPPPPNRKAPSRPV